MKTAIAAAAATSAASYAETPSSPLICPDSVDPEKSFSFVVIPDVHVDFLCKGEHLRTMSKWIVDQRARCNIQFVAQLGDAGDRRGAGDINSMQKLARDSMQPILDAGLPLTVCIGNHDYDFPSNRRANKSWNAPGAFGLEFYQSLPGFGSTFEQEAESPGIDPGGTASHYMTLSIAGRDYLLLTLELGARRKVMHWADALVRERYPNHELMVFTHSYLHTDGKRVGRGTKFNPKGYAGFSTDPGPEYTLDGEEQWQEYFRRWPRLRMIHSGHAISGPRQALQISSGDAGNRVTEWFCNWQEWGYDPARNAMVHSLNAPHVATMLRLYNVDLQRGEVRLWNYMPTAGVVGEEAVPSKTVWG
jgi:hypothetical protein